MLILAKSAQRAPSHSMVNFIVGRGLYARRRFYAGAVSRGQKREIKVIAKSARRAPSHNMYALLGGGHLVTKHDIGLNFIELFI